MKSELKIDCRPVTPELWSDLEQLFGKSGAFWGCWCMYWRCSNKEFEAMSNSEHKNALQKAVNMSENAPGILAYVDNKPVGWVAVSPREDYTRLIKSRVIKKFDDQSVWSIVCFFIHKDFRGTGVTKALIQGAETYAKSKAINIYLVLPNQLDKLPPFCKQYPN